MIRRNTIYQILQAVFITLFSVFLLYIFLRNTLRTIDQIRYGYSTASWQETPGKVLSSKRFENRRGRRTTTHYRIICQYTYKGESHITSNLGQGEGPLQLYQKTQSAHNLPVFVNPDHPAEAALSRGVKKFLWVQLFLFSLLAFALPGFLFWCLRKIIGELRVALFSKPRDCQWGSFSTPEEMINDLRRGNGQVAIIENRQNPNDILYLYCNDDSQFYMVTGGNRDTPAQYISPEMDHKTALAFLKAYAQGLSRLKLAGNWKESI